MITAALTRLRNAQWRVVEVVGLIGFCAAALWQQLNERALATGTVTHVSAAPVLLAMLCGGVASAAIWRRKRDEREARQ
ncbi:MAG: hypothetical protein IT353_18840 [Gemmatimonadaceae bacterium]|nr:hypothetical protein [Gemmatimonadaceae bacterium]